MNRNKQRGTSLERDVADYLMEELDDDRIDRLVLRGTMDRGDIGGVRSAFGDKIAIEVKNHSRLDLSGWMDEARAEAGNYDAPIAVVVHKRRGKGKPGAQYVTMTVDDLIALIHGVDVP